MAHSYMTLPRPEVAGYCGVNTPERKLQKQCRGPCPDPEKAEDQLTDACPDMNAQFPGQICGRGKPVGFADQFQRGQKVETQWLRNNHNHGFVRFSLVPLSKRMDKGAHNKFAFHYSCYDADRNFECVKRPVIPAGPDKGMKEYCGTGHYTYQHTITIPKYVPDGEYVLAWSWIGGEDFSDMWSCSKVLIRGGPKEASGVPQFVSTQSFGRGGDGTCWSRVDRHEVCRDQCTDAVSKQAFRVPADFANGKTPSPITEADYHAAM